MHAFSGVIIPTLWLYLQHTYNASESFYSIVLSAFSFSSLVVGPFFGAWIDFSHKTKATLFIGIIFEIGGTNCILQILHYLCAYISMGVFLGKTSVNQISFSWLCEPCEFSWNCKLKQYLISWSLCNPSRNKFAGIWGKTNWHI